MKLKDFYSTKDAYKYLVERGHSISYGTFKSHIHVYKHIAPIRFGTDGKNRPRALLFTRRLLNAYINGERPCAPTEAEKTAVVGADEAMELSGLRRRELDKMPGRVIGGVLVILRTDAEKFGW